MTEFEILRQHIKLNRQALQLIDEEYRKKRTNIIEVIKSSQLSLLLLDRQVRLEKHQNTEIFDLSISRQIEAIQVLLEEIGERVER